ncbi:MAG: hypothetical protein CM1200mP41_36670 [Gammaproteobacteria bacterium]|nr:MAG: hypothetical protein CM1200mP41_36670 [Gammaproteobacteria bacterium]
MISPGDRVLVPIFGRFGHLLTEIASRCRAEVINIETEWGSTFEADQVAERYVGINLHRGALSRRHIYHYGPAAGRHWSDLS